MNPAQHDCSESVRRYVAFFERLRPAMLNEIDYYFAPDAHFSDPFNDVSGCEAIRHIFEHMFANTEDAAFRIERWMCEGNEASIRWKFDCRIKGRTVSIPGMSFVRFNHNGQAQEHTDYWDPAAGMYEQLPLLGPVLRTLRQRFSPVNTKQ